MRRGGLHYRWGVGVTAAAVLFDLPTDLLSELLAALQPDVVLLLRGGSGAVRLRGDVVALFKPAGMTTTHADWEDPKLNQWLAEISSRQWFLLKRNLPN